MQKCGSELDCREHRCYFALVSDVVCHEEIRPGAGAGLHASVC